MGEVVTPWVAMSSESERKLPENRRSMLFALKGLASNFLERSKALVAGADPVAVLVWCDGAECVCPADPLDGPVGADLVELLLAGCVVLGFRVENFRGTGVGGILDEDGDGHACTRARTEDLSALSAAALTRGALVALQVVDEDLGELFLQ